MSFIILKSDAKNNSNELKELLMNKSNCENMDYHELALFHYSEYIKLSILSGNAKPEFSLLTEIKKKDNHVKYYNHSVKYYWIINQLKIKEKI